MRDALELVHGLRLEDGRTWGEVATSWQGNDAAAVLDLDGGPRMHYQVRPRGGSKTSDAAGLALAVLLVQAPRRARLHAYAASKDQAALLLDALGGWVERSGLTGAVQVETHRVLVPATGATLTVESADDASSWGRQPYLAVVDELAAWPDSPRPRRLWSSIVSSLPKRADSRLVVLTAAGDPAHWAHRVLEDARASPRWRTSEVPGPTPWHDPDDLAEQRRLLTGAQFDRLVLGRWTAGEDRLATLEAIRRCVVLDGWQDPRPGVRYLVSADLGLVRDRTAIAVAHRNAATVVLDRLVVLQGTKARPVALSQVEDALVELSGMFGRPRFVCDPWQAVGMVQRLQARGLRVEAWPFTAQSVGRLGTALHLAIRDQLLAIPPDDELIDELAHVRLRETPSGVRLDHDSGRHDDRAVALALLVHELTRTEPGRMTVGVPYGSMSELRRRGPLTTVTAARRSEPDGLRAARAGAVRQPSGRAGLPVGVADRLAHLKARR